jgi:hypothetical protein
LPVRTLHCALSCFSLQKWQDELRDITEPGFFERNSIYINYKFTKDPKITWFQVRINHRILGTNDLLKKNEAYL